MIQSINIMTSEGRAGTLPLSCLPAFPISPLRSPSTPFARPFFLFSISHHHNFLPFSISPFTRSFSSPLCHPLPPTFLSPLSFSSLLISVHHSALNLRHSQEQRTTSRTHKHPPLQNRAMKMTTVYFSFCRRPRQSISTAFALRPGPAPTPPRLPLRPLNPHPFAPFALLIPNHYTRTLF